MQQHWTRRHFLQAAGLTVAAQGTRLAIALPLLGESKHAYVAIDHGKTRSGIGVFQVHNGAWQPIQFVEAVAPSAIALHRDSGLLFVANARRTFHGLPTASVESYRIHPQHRTLTRISQQPLALATILPHALALSPDGSLLVAAAAAGLYNMLPITPEGSIGEVTAVRKELCLDASSIDMSFVDHNRLQVNSTNEARLYECNREGMHLLEASPALPSSQSTEQPGLAVPGQRAIALVRFP